MIVGMPPPFMELSGSYKFYEPSPMWGYLPQLNQWGGIHLVWETERSGGLDHIPTFEAIPVYKGERLEVFRGKGTSKKDAKEDAARQMATSGHCLSAEEEAALKRAVANGQCMTF